MRNFLIIYLVIFFLFITPRINSQQDLSPEQIYEKVNDAVVIILAYDENDRIINQGSGVVISEEGYIITNYHLMEDAVKVTVMHGDLFFKDVELIGGDNEMDVLFIKVPPSNLSVIKMLESDNIKVGQKVYAIGSPLGYENTISDGIVSGYRKFNKINLIQITASISPGSSGGAVVNSKGELIGISTYSAAQGQNLNFAISIRDIRNIEIKPFEFISPETDNFSNLQDSTENRTKNIFPNDKIYSPKAVEYFKIGKELQSKAKFEKGKKNKTILLKKAIDNFYQTIKFDSSFIEAYYEIGSIYGSRFELNDFEKAEKFFNEVERLINNSKNDEYFIKSNREILVEIADFYRLQEIEIKRNSLKALDFYKRALIEPLPAVVPSYPQINNDDIYFAICETYRQLANYITLTEQSLLGYIDAKRYFELAIDYFNKLSYDVELFRREILNDKKVLDFTSNFEWKIFINYNFKSVIYRLGRPLIANDFLFIYHFKSLEKNDKGIIKVWIKEVNLKNADDSKENEYDYMKLLYEFDLKKKKFRVLKKIIQYSDEFTTSDSSLNSDWQFVPPESVAEIIIENLKLITR